MPASPHLVRAVLLDAIRHPETGLRATAKAIRRSRMRDRLNPKPPEQPAEQETGPTDEEIAMRAAMLESEA